MRLPRLSGDQRHIFESLGISQVYDSSQAHGKYLTLFRHLRYILKLNGEYRRMTADSSWSTTLTGVV